MSLMMVFLRFSLNASVISHVGLVGSLPYCEFSSSLRLLSFALSVVSQMLDMGLPISRHSWM